jgi:ribosomal small subunit protein bTHX
MGKGDKRSFKGKVFKGSYGKTRPHKLPKTKTGTAGGTKKK